jgi:hypothetical protein
MSSHDMLPAKARKPTARKHHTQIFSTGSGEVMVGQHPDDGDDPKIVTDTLVNLSALR